MAIAKSECYEGGQLNGRAMRALVPLVPAVVMLFLRDQLAWTVSYPVAWVVPITRWIDTAMNRLIHSFNLGFFSSQEFTRGIAWTLAQPLKWAEGLLAASRT